MKYEIVYNKETNELIAIKRYLDMENIHYTYTESSDYLKYTNGKPCPVIKTEDNILIGFYELIEYIKDKGLRQV